MMAQAHWTNYWLKLEDWRLRQHFKRVENILRKQDTSHLPEALQKARESQLETLHRYAQRSIFPRNHSEKSYTPCFIDREGRECAVAHLLMQSEQNELVQTIVQKANYAYVPEMKFPELEQWADESGLTKEEVALIQPGISKEKVIVGSKVELSCLSPFSISHASFVLGSEGGE
jgi:hypothetical protein